MKLSALILSKGEPSIDEALKSVEFADEIIVILDGNYELDLKVKNNVRIVRHDLTNDFAQQRNFASSQAKGEWLLFLDSDEVLTKELEEEIVKVINDTAAKTAYNLKRRDFFWGKELKFGETQKIRTKGLIRLMKKNSGSWKGEVHEEYLTNEPVGRLNGYINHYPHQTISDFLRAVNRYSSLRAKQLKADNSKFSAVKMIFLPPSKFFYTYILKLGFLDGSAGFVYSFMMSFHSFLVRAKLLTV